jgi:LysR family transcriptional regulator, regulator for genes of the gallate degradation pathway
METIAGLSLRHLRVFETVAKLQNVNKAADVVHLTQSAVTQAIAKLETQLGAKLFKRSSNGTYLTPAGEVFAARIATMFSQIEQALANIGASESIAERMTRPQIRALSAVAKGDLLNEAEAIGISKASLLRAARQLERSIGKQLLHQSVRGVSTTEIGRDLAHKLQIAMHEAELGIEEVSRETKQDDNRLRIGAMPLSGTFIVTAVLNNLLSRFPDARVDIRSSERARLIEELRRGEIDLIVGLLSKPANSEWIIQEALIALPYVIVARPSHPLAGKTDLTQRDFQGYNWVSPNYDTTRRAVFDQLAKTLKIPPTATVQASSTLTIKFLLSGYNRLALLTRFEFEQAKGSGELIEIPFGPIEPTPWLGITRRVNWTPSSLHLQLIELIRREATNIKKASSAAKKRTTTHS